MLYNYFIFKRNRPLPQSLLQSIVDPEQNQPEQIRQSARHTTTQYYLKLYETLRLKTLTQEM